MLQEAAGPREEGAAAEALVIGAGPAGLAAGAELRRRGIEPLLLERGGGPGQAWRGHYDRLCLNTYRGASGLPGFAIPREYGRWPKREQVVTYLETYADRHKLQIRTSTEVSRIDREDDGWRVTTDRGTFRSPTLVVATGYCHSAKFPDWPGIEGFTGRLIHSSDYRNASEFAGDDVLVVGGGYSAAEIAVDLAQNDAERVRLAVRSAPHVVPKTIGPIPTLAVAIHTRHLPAWVGDGIVAAAQKLLIGDLTRYGLPRPEVSVSKLYSSNDVVPISQAEFPGELRAGRIEVVPGVEGVDGADVLLAGGERVQPQVVIAATGYRRDLGPLAGHLGLVGEDDLPLVHGEETAPDSPGLYFIGFTNPLSGNLRELGIDARRIARAVSREHSARSARPVASA